MGWADISINRWAPPAIRKPHFVQFKEIRKSTSGLSYKKFRRNITPNPVTYLQHMRENVCIRKLRNPYFVQINLKGQRNKPQDFYINILEEITILTGMLGQRLGPHFPLAVTFMHPIDGGKEPLRLFWARKPPWFGLGKSPAHGFLHLVLPWTCKARHQTIYTATHTIGSKCIHCRLLKTKTYNKCGGHCNNFLQEIIIIYVSPLQKHVVVTYN